MEYAMGSVEMAMMNAAAVELAALYRIPVYASAGVTEAKHPDIQAGFEKSLSNLMVAMNRPDLVHLAAGMLDSGNTIAYEQYVIDNEIIGMICRFLDGIQVNEKTLARDVIEKVGSGANYVTEDHTLEHMTTEFFYPSLAQRCNFDVWKENKCPDILSLASKQVQEILDSGPQGLLDPEVVTKTKKTFPSIQNI